MSAFEEIVLFDAMKRARAYERMNDPDVLGKVNWEGMLNLALQAGYPRRQAEKIAADWSLERLRKEMPA